MSLAASFLLAARQQEVAHLQALAHSCELVRRTGSLVHQLQAERGMSNLLLGSIEQRFLSQWQTQCLDTDAVKQAFVQTLTSEATNLTENGGSRLCSCIALTLEDLGMIDAVRQQTASATTTPVEATTVYCNIIRRLISLIFEAVDAAAEPSVARLLVALLNLIEAKEYCGIERATGSRIHSSGMLSETDASQLATLIAQQDQAFSRFEDFSDDPVRQQWLILKTLMPLPEIESMRQMMLTKRAGQTGDADSWFMLCSERINRLHEVENYLANHLQQICESRVQEAQKHQLETSKHLRLTIDTQDSVSIDYHDGLLESRISRNLYDLLKAQSQSMLQMNDELLQVRASLEDRKRIDRAKGLLMAEQGITEDAAYNLMRQKAMNEKTRIIDVALAVIEMAERLNKHR